MSVVTALLAFAPAIAARFKPPAIIPAASNEGENLIDRALFDKALRTCAKLLAQRRRLEGEVTALRAELASARLDRDAARAELQSQAWYRQQQALAQAQMAQLAQYQAAQQGPYQQAQNLFDPRHSHHAFGDFCNCVPARHDMLLGGLGGS
jgi:hypothetical protein